MGDKRRFSAFAQFIQNTFPQAINVADIAVWARRSLLLPLSDGQVPGHHRPTQRDTTQVGPPDTTQANPSHRRGG